MKNSVDLTLPRARTQGLIVKELPDETLVYDLERDLAHCLNSTAAFVWKNCDGQKTVSEIEGSLPTSLSNRGNSHLVWLALDQLEEFRLLEQSVPIRVKGISRRHLIRTAGFAAAAIPLITSIIVPHAAQAQSCGVAPLPDDCPCTSSTQCVSGCCRNVAGVTQCKTGAGGCL